jgi:D-serine deaminase-like pyridoxal phosphate-dependent protein
MQSTASASTVDWATKGLWLPDEVAGVEDLVGASLFAGPFTWPVMVASRSAIDANVATMAAYCDRHDVDFAPHGKTSMAPTLFAAQLDAGAWGITVATANQALAARRFGVPRVVLANELLDPRVVRWAAGEADSGWELLFYVDSLAGVEVLRAGLSGLTAGVDGRSASSRAEGARLRVLVEVGYPGGRTGCRTVDEAVRVARAAAAVPGVELAGVAAFEGMLPDQEAVTDLLTTVVAAATAITGTGVADGAAYPWIVSAGGSAFFDTVVAVLGPAARANGWRVLLRSGAVISHDDGRYATSTPFNRVPEDGSLTAALQVWAQVLSTPEPGLAILGAGKRDVPYDLGLPVPVQARGIDGVTRPLAGASVTALNDQHAYLHGADVEPGELVRLGISHPCTAFDKWRVIPVVDDDYRIVDLLHTYF